jgi:hypothetical protein
MMADLLKPSPITGAGAMPRMADARVTVVAKIVIEQFLVKSLGGWTVAGPVQWLWLWLVAFCYAELGDASRMEVMLVNSSIALTSHPFYRRIAHQLDG